MHFDKKFWGNVSVVGLDSIFFFPETTFSPKYIFSNDERILFPRIKQKRTIILDKIPNIFIIPRKLLDKLAPKKTCLVKQE